MSDAKLFRLTAGKAEELTGRPVRLEKDIQNLIEANLESFLHVRLVASEYSTGKTHAGRIDTLGFDENGCPTIIEYKRHANANVINQGLFYLDWLMDHQAEFELLILRKFGADDASRIDWSAPRLLCMAEDFTRYDVHAVQQINRNIELIRYLQFGDDLLLLTLVNAVVAVPGTEAADGTPSPANPEVPARHYPTQQEYLAKASPQLIALYEALREHMADLGDDVQERFLKWYIAYKRLKNIATVQLQNQKNNLLMWLPLDPETVEMESGFSRDVRGVGHHGTGDVELTLRTIEDLEKAKSLIQRSFEEN